VIEVLHDATQYAKGDLLNQMRDRWGELYSQYLTCSADRQYMWVADRVSPEIRPLSPSYSHSRAVAGLDVDQQVYWLGRAKAEVLSVHDLEALIKEAAGKEPGVRHDWEAARAYTASKIGQVWTLEYQQEVDLLLGAI